MKERGMVTVEVALGAIALMLATLAGLWLVGVVGLQLRCVDTAGETARQLARGDRVAAERVAGDRPAGASVRSRREGNEVVVTVQLKAQFVRVLPAVPLTAEARVLLEPGA